MRRSLLLFVPLVFSLATPEIACGHATPSAQGARMAAATEHHDATMAALAVMEGGGSAADGAIAAALVLGVVNPGASGLGGGGFALVYDAKTKKTTALDFRERAGAAIDGKVLGTHGVPSGKVGAAVGIPGEPAGLVWLQKHYGKKTLAEDAAPAVAIARDGFPLAPHLEGTAMAFRKRLEDEGELVRALYKDPSAAKATTMAVGTIVKRPQLAATLERFGREGDSVFYKSLAPQIVAAAKKFGGTLTEADLASYTVEERAPLVGQFGGRTVFTMPAPSAGGLMLLENLTLFGADKSSELFVKGFASSESYHLIAEGMRGAYADRMAHVGDPKIVATVTQDVANDLTAPRLAARRKSISSDATHDSAFFASREGGTTHLVVVDKEGNVVSLTTTVNSPFGSGIEVAGAGFLLNDELWDFSTDEEAKPFVKAGGTLPNSPRPLARPVSSMTPTIVFENGAPIFAVGGSGGQRIATGTTQVTMCRLIYSLDPSSCISAPRVHIAGTPGLSIEPETVIDVRQGLEKRGETLREEVSFSAITAIAMAPGQLWAASDPRKYGFAAAK
jgi:gamma-glutamyltranspeptidase/glutathione hydrolase